MSLLNIDEFVNEECEVAPRTLEDYASDTPRWCKGCGDHGVLMAIQGLLRDDQVPPENVVAVSGIGCSSRLPHYLRTYGFHGIHGRALPLSLGVKLARPELNVLTIMGDGDCFSIGAGHWLHTLRYNPDILVVVLDNEVYALTKKQASPTSRQGEVTNTTPHGAYLKSLNPLTVILGVSNVSFLAQTTTWFPQHMEETLRRAWNHRGLSFVRIMQRCPVYMPHMFSGPGQMVSMFLEHEDGVPFDHSLVRKSNILPHNPRDISAAHAVALMEDVPPVGLIYWNPDVPIYEEIRHGRVTQMDNPELLNRLNAHLDKFTVRLNP